jgi:hypothetical protein
LTASSPARGMSTDESLDEFIDAIIERALLRGSPAAEDESFEAFVDDPERLMESSSCKDGKFLVQNNTEVTILLCFAC